MVWKGEQVKQFHQALLSAFPDKAALQHLVLTELDENLDAIAGGANLAEVVLSLIVWAKACGRLDELVEKAYQVRPGNPKLHDFAEQEQHLTQEVYLRYLLDRYQHIDPQGMPARANAPALKLDAVYISLTAEQERERTLERDDLYETDPNARKPLRADRPQHPDLSKPVGAPVGLFQAVEAHRYMILLGDPGAGKTTLTRFLAVRMAEALLEASPDVKDSDQNSYGAPRLPIFLRVADYADALKANRNCSLREYLPEAFGDVAVSRDRLRTLMGEALQNDQAIVLLDGLDEVADAGLRSDIAARINSFVAGLQGKNRLLVTSRLVGYTEARLGAAFKTYRMRGLEPEQIARFLERYCAAYERHLRPDISERECRLRAEEERGKLLAALQRSEGAHHLAKNPLLLTILAFLHRNHAYLPERRVRLYEEAAETLLVGWRKAQAGADAEEILPREADLLLAPLAFEMHQRDSTGLITKEEALDRLHAYQAQRRKKEPDDPDVCREVADFWRRLTEHTGLFVERAPARWGFLHLTFEEFYASRWLTRSFLQAPKAIAERRHLARWEEPIRLAIAAQSEENADYLVRAAIWSPEGERRHPDYQPGEYEEILRRDLLLAARCLGDCESIEPLLAREVAAALVAICLEKEGKGTLGPLVEWARNTLGTVRDCAVGVEALQALIIALKEEKEGSVRRAAAAALGTVGQGSPEALQALLTALREDKVRNVRYEAARALGTVGQGSDEALQALLTALKEEKDASVRQEAMAALRTVGQGTAEALQTLLAALKEKEGKVRYEALRTLGAVGQGSTEALQALLTALREDKVWNVRYAAARALGTVGQGSDKALQALLMTLREDRVWNVRYVAARALDTVGQGSSEALQTLLTALKEDKDGSVRHEAAAALRTVGQGSDEALQALLMALRQDKVGSVRRAAASALGTVGQGSDEALQALLTIVKEEKDESVRRAAAGALGTVGQGSDEALQVLLTALKEEKDASVRYAMWEAIHALVTT